jgi:hypothetical protein
MRWGRVLAIAGLGCLALPGAVAQAAPAPAVGAPAANVAAAVHGRIDTWVGLRVVHVWGTPQERGFAHGKLLAKDIAGIVTAEFSARFSRLPGLLNQARGAVGRVVTFPDDVREEIEAVYAGLVAAGVSREMPELDREFDLTDLLVANALDVFGLMGCSGFTVWGERAVGGGVLTGRNFDWPLTGAHMLDGTVLLVQHLADGRAVASVTWPGYVGSVTAVNNDGVCAFLHVGTGKITRMPEPDSWPTAVAAQLALRAFDVQAPAEGLAKVQDLLGYTSPPAGYLTRIVLPTVPPDGSPAAVFEADAHKALLGARSADAPEVVTNHFLARKDGRAASRDSVDREKRIRGGLARCLTADDQQVSVDEGWEMLRSVQRGGSHAFGTLHSLVFRNAPWHFELRIADLAEQGVVAAPDAARRHVLTREQVFPADPTVVPATAPAVDSAGR